MSSAHRPVPVPLPGGSHSSLGSKKRSLLGYDDPEGEEMLKTTQEQIKSQTDAKIGQLLEGMPWTATRLAFFVCWRFHELTGACGRDGAAAARSG